MITPCPFCSKRLKINDNLAGKRGTCPACKQIFTIPVISAEPPEGRKAARSTSLRAALSEETSRRAAEIPPTISSAASSTNVAEGREVSTQSTQRSAPAPPRSPMASQSSTSRSSIQPTSTDCAAGLQPPVTEGFTSR